MPFFCFFLSETTEKRTAHKIWLLRTQVRKRTVEIEYYFLLKPNHPTRAVKKFLSSRLLLNSRWLWTSHQRHKCLTAKASRTFLKFRVLGMLFPEVFNRYFQRGCHVVSSEYIILQDWEECCRNVPSVPRHRTV